MLSCSYLHDANVNAVFRVATNSARAGSGHEGSGDCCLNELHGYDRLAETGEVHNSASREMSASTAHQAFYTSGYLK
jgi:hypothetical protein